jgi:hypothetical protein
MNFKLIISFNLLLVLYSFAAAAQAQIGLKGMRTYNFGTSNFTTPTYQNPTGFAFGGTSQFPVGRIQKPFCYSLNCDEGKVGMAGAANYMSIERRNRNLQQGLMQTLKSENTCALEFPTTDFDNIAEATDVAACYKNRNTPSTVAVSDFQKFQQDDEVCGCLRRVGQTVPSVGEMMNTPLARIQGVKVGSAPTDMPTEEQKLENFERNTTRIRDEMNRNSSAMSFQASVMQDLSGVPVAPNQIDNFAKAYSTDPLGRNPASITAAGIGQGEGFLRGVLGPGRGSRQRMSRVDNFRGTYLSGLLDDNREGAEKILNLLPDIQRRGPDTSPAKTRMSEEQMQTKLNTALFKMAEPGGAVQELFQPVDIRRPSEKDSVGQCVSAREFMAYKQLPGPEMIDEMKNDSGNISDWNYNTLKSEYKRIMALPYPEKQDKKARIQSLKTRITFLERNPMLKNFLKAEPESNDRYFGIIRTSDEDKIRAAYGADPAQKIGPLNERKSALVGMMKNLVPNAGCNSECMAKNTKNILEFFAKPANNFVTITENNKTNAFLSDDFISNRAELFAGRPESTNRSSYDRAFTSYGLGSPATCDAESKLDICVRTYAGYCQFLKNKNSEIEQLRDMDPVLQDDLEAKTSKFFDPNPATNTELGDFIKSVCNTPRRKVGDQSGKYQTFWQYFNDKCKTMGPGACDDVQKIQQARGQYLTEYPDPAAPNTSVSSVEIATFNKIMVSSNVGRGVSDSTKAAMASGSSASDIASLLNSSNRDWGFEDNIVTDGAVNSKLADSGISNGTTPTKVDNKIDNSSVIDDPASMAGNYSMFNGAAANGTTPTVAGSEQPQKVENMSDPQRQELMDEWQKEYDAWKKNKGSDTSAAASATETAMKARIEALEQLLSQQKKLTEDQYKLLNDAIANQSRAASQNVAAAQSEQGASQSSGRSRSVASVSAAAEEESSRGPASVQDQRAATAAGAASGAGSAGVGSGSSSSSRRATVSSSDDVAREEAKLVNMRSNSDGSIVISAVNTNSGAVANAVSVPVSDEQYRALQANPQSLNLSQIEKSIPQDQIAKLEKDGEITILLRNGSNPPFEVKVEKKNNKLVYSLKDKNGKDQAPVRRVFTRQALELQLKANR